LAHLLLFYGANWNEDSIQLCVLSRRGKLKMNTKDPQKLADNLEIPCYACEQQPATHVCRYEVGELAVQVCLCDNCMKIDTAYLLKNTVGIQELAPSSALQSMVQL
jgi:hypothetical protein